MVLPITGPTTKVSASGDYFSNGSVYGVRSVYRQVKPYTLPLPYAMFAYTQVDGWAVTYVQSDSWGGHWLGQWWKNSTTLRTTAGNAFDLPLYKGSYWSDLTNVQDLALNRAREKFFSKANQRVSLSVDVLQRKEAYDMLTRRTLQAAKAFGHLRRLDWRNVMRTLGLKKPAGWRPALSGLGGLWLEFSYGWKPLVDDIHKAAEILSAPWDPQWIHESHVSDYDVVKSAVVDQGSNGSKITYENHVKLKVFARVGGVVTLANPNLQAYKNAGLTNPLSWAWELLPFSFVVDWFTSVGQFINSFDDTVGLNIVDGFYSYGMKGSSNVSAVLNRRYSGWPLTPGRAVGDFGWKSRSVASMNRIRGIPTVKLVRKLKILTNTDRGLNAASLLAQVLGNSPGRSMGR